VWQVLKGEGMGVLLAGVRCERGMAPPPSSQASRIVYTLSLLF